MTDEATKYLLQRLEKAVDNQGIKIDEVKDEVAAVIVTAKQYTDAKSGVTDERVGKLELEQARQQGALSMIKWALSTTLAVLGLAFTFWKLML